MTRKFFPVRQETRKKIDSINYLTNFMAKIARRHTYVECAISIYINYTLFVMPLKIDFDNELYFEDVFI